MQRNTEFDVTMQSSVLEWGTVQSGLFRANNLEFSVGCSCCYAIRRSNSQVNLICTCNRKPATCSGDSISLCA